MLFTLFRIRFQSLRISIGYFMGNFSTIHFKFHQPPFSHPSTTPQPPFKHPQKLHNLSTASQPPINHPTTTLKDATRENSEQAFEKFTKTANESSKYCTLRGQMDFVAQEADAVSIDEVEPASNIVKRFCTGRFALIVQLIIR